MLQVILTFGFSRTVLLFHPDPSRDPTNRRALTWLLGVDQVPDGLSRQAGTRMIALLPTANGPRLLTAHAANAAAYVAALRAYFQRYGAAELDSALG